MTSNAVAVNISDESEEDIPPIMRTNTTLRAPTVYAHDSSNDDDVKGVTNPIDHFANQYTINKMVKNRKHRHTAVNGYDSAINKPSQKRDTDSADVISSRRYGVFFSGFIPFLISTYAYHSFAYFIPNLPFLFVFVGYSNHEHLLMFRIFIAAFVILVLALLHWSYLKAKYSHPGPIPKAWQEWDGNLWTRPSDPIYAIDTSMEAASMVITKRSKLYCAQCKMFRPSRTGHCRRCNICVTRIDHHCVFLNNCIGSNNQRYFVQFLVYGEILLFMYLVAALFTRLNHTTGNLWVIYGILPLIGAVAFIFILVLLAGQVRAIVRNQTFTEYKFRYKDASKTSVNETRMSSCWTKFKQRMEERKQWRNAKKNTPKNDDEIKALLSNTEITTTITTSEEEKDESEELSSTFSENTAEKMRNENDKFLRFDLKSKWKNVQTVLGSSMLHWFLPLDWTEEEQYKRMMDGSHSFDTLPCRHRIKRHKHSIAID